MTWETDVPCRGVVAWTDGVNGIQVGVGDSLDTLHHVPLKDLEPDTTYSYTVY